MMLWAALSAMLLVAALLICIPLLRRSHESYAPEDQGLALYREQAKELAREVADGTISSEDATATRREIERGILAVAKRQEGIEMTAFTDRGRLLGIGVTMAWVAVGSAILYGFAGRPDLAGRAPAAPEAAAAPQAEAPQPGAVNAMIAGLAARLEREPGDIDGWRMLGWSYYKVGQFDQAAAAYGRAVALAPDDGELLSLQGEALVSAANGSVHADAQALFQQSLAIDPANPRARYFAGVMLDEAGDTKAAVALWLALVDAAPPGASWLPDLRQHIRARADAAGVDLSNRPDLLAAPPAPTQASKGPSSDEIAAAAEMTPEARQTMIRGMVDGLAARLETAPDDSEGWLRLIRAYGVLADMPAATAALAKARSALAANPEAIAALQVAASELGLK